MEKFISPLKTSEDVGERCEKKTLMEKEMSAETTSEDLELIYEKLSEKTPTTLTNVNDKKSGKVKKCKIKKSRGEKRKFPEKSDSLKKFKRKKKEKLENITTPDGNILTDEHSDLEELPVEEAEPSTPQENITIKKEDPTAIETEFGVKNKENKEGLIIQKSSKKNKSVANKCKETLNILLKYNSDVLESLANSMKILESHSFLNNKYISVDILSDLITLALETSRKSAAVDFEKELSLLMIINKCTSKLCATPKTSKPKQGLMAVPGSPKSKSQEEVSSSTPTLKEIVLEKWTPKCQILEEPMEQCIISLVELPEKNQEPAVEKSGKNFCITNYFKKLKKTVEERDRNERFSCFKTKTDMFLAPKLGGELTGERREKFEEEFSSQNVESNYLAEQFSKSTNLKKKVDDSKKENKSSCVVENINEHSSSNPAEVLNICTSGGAEVAKIFTSNEVEISEITKSQQTTRKRAPLIRVDKPKADPIEVTRRMKAKLLQFHDNRRPPYWGTWRKKSVSVGPRKPFGKDKMFNYEIDSDDEWEEEEEPGESLHGSDDDKEPEEDYEVDNDFFVPHGYLSDDENPEKENSFSKKKLDLLEEQFTSEQKQKTRKMTPIVFGTFWIYKGLPFEGNAYQDLQIDGLQYVPWTTIPIEIEEEEKRDNLPDTGEPTSQVKKYKIKTFPDEEIPNLIKMIHGSPQNSNHLARKFLLYWETEKVFEGDRPGLTKVCVQKKIKELAAWQTNHEKKKMCWFVPKETREEFKAEVESNTPEKKSRKCFFWKFVRKAEKSPGGGTTPPPAPAPPIEPEVLET